MVCGLSIKIKFQSSSWIAMQETFLRNSSHENIFVVIISTNCDHGVEMMKQRSSINLTR